MANEDGWEDCDKPTHLDALTILTAETVQRCEERRGQSTLEIFDGLENTKCERVLAPNGSEYYRRLPIWSDVAPTEPGWYWVSLYGRRAEAAELLDEMWYLGHVAVDPVGQQWKFGPKLTPPPAPK